MPENERPRNRRRQRRRRRRADGRFVETVELDDVLTVFGTVDGPVVTTTDVADEFGLSTEAARTKLNDLVASGDLRRRETGRTVVYWQSATDERAAAAEQE